jgi:ribonuclease VapC
MIFDASAVLALLRKEPGGETVARHLPDGMISAINLAEAMAVLVRKGMPADEAQEVLDELELIVVPFDREQAYRTGRLALITDARGLSLGDRACLALAETRRRPALTAEKQWDKINAGVKIVRIR